MLGGLRDVARGLRLVLTVPRLRTLALVPCLLTGLVFSMGLVAAFFGSAALSDWLLEGNGWLWEGVRWLFRAVSFVGLAWGLFLTLGFIIEVVGGPFLELIVRERSDAELPSVSFMDGTVFEAGRSLGMGLLVLGIGVASFLPGVGPFAAATSALLAWWSLGFACVSPVLQAHGRTFSERGRFARTNAAYLAAMGMVVAFGLVVPVLGWVLIPAAVAGCADRGTPRV